MQLKGFLFVCFLTFKWNKTTTIIAVEFPKGEFLHHCKVQWKKETNNTKVVHPSILSFCLFTQSLKSLISTEFPGSKCFTGENNSPEQWKSL